MMAAAFFMTCSSDNLDGLVNLSIRAFFSASSFSRLRISSEDFSASARAIFSISALALGTTVDSSSVAVISRLHRAAASTALTVSVTNSSLDSLAECLARLRLLVARLSRNKSCGADTAEKLFSLPPFPTARTAVCGRTPTASFATPAANPTSERVNDRNWACRHCPEGDPEYRYRQVRYAL